MATRRKKNDPAEALVPADPVSPNGTRATRSRRKTTPATPPKEVTAVTAVVSRPVPVDPAKVAETERQVQEVCELAAQLRLQLQEAEAQANGAIAQINRVREQAREAVRLQHEAEQRARQAEREAEHALQTAREVGRRMRSAEEQHEAAWERAMREIAEDIHLVRQRRKAARNTAPEASVPAPLAAPEPANAAAAPAVELVPDDAPARDETVLRASVRSEAPTGRLIRHLQQALAVKAAVRDALNEAAGDSFDRAITRPLRQQAELTQVQSKELEERLRALGGEPEGNGKGVFNRLLGWAFDGWGREPDDLDRTVQGVHKAIAGQGLEMAMGQWLAPLARAQGDEATARLAERHWRQKEGAIAELRTVLVPLAGVAGRMSEVARVAQQPLKVEAAVATEEEANGASK